MKFASDGNKKIDSSCSSLQLSHFAQTYTDFAFMVNEFASTRSREIGLPLLIESAEFPLIATTGTAFFVVLAGLRSWREICGCLSGQADLITYMLEKGADVHAETTDGDSPLYLTTYAILNMMHRDLNSLLILIRAGCNINKQNKRGYTPLHRAASKGDKVVIKFLLEHGADPYIANTAGVYPIDCAICAGHIEAAEMLKIKFPSPYVWDVVEPHTPLNIKLGLQSPQRNLLLESSKPRVLRKILM
ncbi:hypothetical protein BaRGS_00015566 [Batillaria attramentaria]|uniref:Uncharacterized protein n=1 Tax=Batillaria attramentaria TaxID=370345 RepID=A0ABD0L156_9CAEN